VSNVSALKTTLKKVFAVRFPVSLLRKALNAGPLEAAGATHLRPVVSTLSATMLQLGKGIVLSTIVCKCA
jgi:hypothetical protein